MFQWQFESELNSVIEWITQSVPVPIETDYSRSADYFEVTLLYFGIDFVTVFDAMTKLLIMSRIMNHNISKHFLKSMILCSIFTRK